MAAKVGFPPERVFKTLVVHGDKHGYAVAVVPGNAELDLKAMAKATGDRKVEMIPLKDVQLRRGWVRGDVSWRALPGPNSRSWIPSTPPKSVRSGIP